MVKQKGICEECKAEYEYEYNAKYPRKYCPKCSAEKKQAFENRSEEFPVEKPYGKENYPSPGYPKEESVKDIKAPTGEYQSLVYNKTLSANSYEVGKAGNRLKIYFESVDGLRAKIKELKRAGLMEEDMDFGQPKETLI